MHLGNTVKFTHMTLSLAPEILNAVDVVCLVCKQFGMVDTKVLEVRYVQNIIFSPAVRIDGAVRNGFTLNNGQQGCLGSIRNDLRIDLASTLQKPRDQDFNGGTTNTLAFAFAAKVTFIKFTLTTEDRVNLQLKMIGNNFA